ncbi:MAG: phage major capsid protein [Steroidobacteraceae bacterium]
MLKKSTHPFTRAVIARVLGETDPESFALKRWGSHSGVAEVVRKAAVAGLDSADRLADSAASDEGFIGLAIEQSLLGRLAGLRRTDFVTPVLRQGAGATAVWVAQSRAIGISKLDLVRTSLSRLMVGALTVVTKQALRAPGAFNEQMLERDLLRAASRAIDLAFLDASNAGIAGQMPASVTSGATSIASSGTLETDIAQMIEAFEGDLSAAAFVCDPTLATEIGLLDAKFAACGARGGELGGIPLFTSMVSPRTTSGGQLTLIDPGAILYAADAIEVSESSEATIEMSDTPSGNAATPVAATTTPISLYQAELTALKLAAYVNWELQDSNRVVMLTGASYRADAS